MIDSPQLGLRIHYCSLRSTISTEFGVRSPQPQSSHRNKIKPSMWTQTWAFNSACTSCMSLVLRSPCHTWKLIKNLSWHGHWLLVVKSPLNCGLYAAAATPSFLTGIDDLSLYSLHFKLYISHFSFSIFIYFIVYFDNNLHLVT